MTIVLAAMIVGQQQEVFRERRDAPKGERQSPET
jgi:hypothetical protein